MQCHSLSVLGSFSNGPGGRYGWLISSAKNRYFSFISVGNDAICTGGFCTFPHMKSPRKVQALPLVIDGCQAMAKFMFPQTVMEVVMQMGP